MEREEEEVTLSFPLWPDDPAQQDAAAAVYKGGEMHLNRFVFARLPFPLVFLVVVVVEYYICFMSYTANPHLLWYLGYQTMADCKCD